MDKSVCRYSPGDAAWNVSLRELRDAFFCRNVFMPSEVMGISLGSSAADNPAACSFSALDDVQNLSHNWVGLAAPNLADLEVAKRNQASRRAPPWQTIHRVR
jgi:hypothetical protein